LAAAVSQTFLVTGATGFVGRHLCRTLAASGQPVHAITRGPAPQLADGVVQHQVSDAVEEFAAVIDEVRPDVVVHLATLFAAQHDAAQVADMVRSNVTFGTVVAEGCLRTGAKLVHATSAWQHYQGATYDPVSLYAATKQALVDVLAYYTGVGGLRAAEVCLFDTYGPEDPRHKLVWLLLDAARSGATVTLSSGTQLIDLTHIDDVVAAILVAAASDVELRLVARSGAPLTLRDLAALVEQVTGRTLAVQWGVRPDRPREMYTDWLVPGAATPWRPRVELAEGLEALWQAEFR
jgi:nucleoside-diphosphate-sugar epimerase